LIWYILGGLIGLIFFKKRYNLTFWQAVWNGIILAFGLYFSFSGIVALIIIILGLQEYSDLPIWALFLYILLAIGCFAKIKNLKDYRKPNDSVIYNKPIKSKRPSSSGHNPGEIIETNIAGVSFEGRQELLKSLHIGQLVRLVREPQNQHDPNAIKITIEDGLSIGYINRNLARKISPILDNMNVKEIKGEISSIYQVKNKPSIIGARIKFQIPDIYYQIYTKDLPLP